MKFHNSIHKVMPTRRKKTELMEHTASMASRMEVSVN